MRPVPGNSIPPICIGQSLSIHLTYSGGMHSLHPGLHVFYSNKTERLASQLMFELSVYRGAEDIWKPVTIVVPNPNVKDYLKATFAETLGAVANLQFLYLEGFWTRFANRRLLDRTTLFGSIFSALQDPDLGNASDLDILARYLEGSPKDLKTVQLSQRLAQHFERVLLNRPDWIRAWDRGLPAPHAEPAHLEAWQRTLWRRLRGGWMNLRERPLPLMDWLQDPAFQEAHFPEAVFFFGMSHMAPLYHQALAQVGTRASVRLYLVNPCLEPWDLNYRERLARSRRTEFLANAPDGEDPFTLQKDRSELILQRWARPSREQLRLITDVVQGDSTGRFSVPTKGTLLSYLQRRILAPERAIPAPVPDDSIQPSLRMVPCPTPRREAETVASLIWELVQESKGDLHFGDIAVLVPSGEQEAYLEHLSAAFRSSHDLPWARAFGASRSLQDLVEGSLLLLDMAGGELTRADLLRAASHPFIQARIGGTPDLWAMLCDQAGIVARLDAHETAGTFLEGGRWTWDEGLTRLALGRFMNSRERVEELDSMGRPVGAGSEATSLLATLGPLVADLRQLSKERCDLPTWHAHVAGLLRTYLGPDPEEATELEATAFADLLHGLKRLNQLEVEGLPVPELDYQAVRPLVTAELEKLLEEQALPPGRGVQVSCYTPLRAIPFKALFLMGLGEGTFPGKDRPDPLDLVASSPRRAGDVSRSEQERQLFLEAVLSTRRNLILTYPSRAPITGEALQPSPLIRDLEETLGKDLWAQVKTAEQPLHRHDLSHFSDLSPNSPDRPLPCHIPEARQEAEVRWLGLNLRERMGGLDAPRHLKDWGGNPTLTAGLEARVNSCGPFSDQDPRPPAHTRITLKELRRWLECSIQGGVALRLGVKDVDDEDPAEVADEPLDTAFLEQWSLRRRSLWASLVHQTDVAECYETLRAEAEASAKASLGTLSLGERTRHLNTLRRELELLGTPGGIALHRFGAGLPFETRGLPIHDHSPLNLSIPFGETTLDLRLEGLTEPMRGDDFLLISNSKGGKQKPNLSVRLNSLRAWLGHIALCAAGESRDRRVLVHCVPSNDEDLVWALSLPAIEPGVATAQLQSWGEQILVEAVQEVVPIEAVMDSKGINSLQDWIQEQSDDEDRPALTSFRGPVPWVKDIPAGDLEAGRTRLQAFLEVQDKWSRG